MDSPTDSSALARPDEDEDEVGWTRVCTDRRGPAGLPQASQRSSRVTGEGPKARNLPTSVAVDPSTELVASIPDAFTNPSILSDQMSSPVRRDPWGISSPVAASPLSQYPFPSHEASQKLGSTQETLPRRVSTTSSLTSIGGALDAASAGGDVIAELGQNAISTLLQPPIVRTGLQPHAAISTTGFKTPTQRDIPPVALTNIPHIESKAFQPYLAQVGSLYEAFQRAKQEKEDETQLFRREKKETKNEEWEAILSSRMQRPAYSRSGSIASSIGSPIESPQPKRRSSGQRRTHTVAPLSTIPSVYAEEDFHIENPRTFDIVSDRSEIVRDPNAAPSGRKTLATNAILQEKLSWYMDTVEIHLISSISSASKSFFSALGSLRELHAEAAESVDRIQKLRKDLSRLDKEMAMGGLKIVNLKQRRDNVRQLAEAIMQLEEVVSAVRKCEEKVERGEIDTALADIDSVESLIAGTAKRERHKFDSQVDSGTPLRDLRTIKALDGAADDLNQLRYRVGRGYETRFHDSLIGDLRRHVEGVQLDVTLQRWSIVFTRLRPGQRRAPSVFPSYMSLGPEFRAELEAEMAGLSRARHTIQAATTFRALVLREMKSLIRKQLPSANDDDNVSTISASTHGGRQKSQQEKSTALARNLRALDPEDSFSMLAKIYSNISEGLRRLSVQVKILLDITSGMGQVSSGNPKSPPSNFGAQSPDGRRNPALLPERTLPTISIETEMQQALDLSSLLGEAVDTVQAQITRVVKVRSQQTAELPLTDFLRFFTLNRLFADECEAISGRSGAGLKSIVDSQIKDFVAHFGNTQRHEIVEVMDSDKWDARDFSDRENILLARVIEGSTSDSPSWAETSMIWQQKNVGSQGMNGNVTNGDVWTTGKDKVRSAVIDEQKFILPESAMAMLRLIESFEQLAAGIPAMGHEVATSLLDCLKLFNSRTSQLILGAGATRSAGLKNINTKHLALSSQSLSFIIALVPYIREFFRRHVSSSSSPQVIADFDKVKRLFQEHQTGIHEKLVDIMSGRASVHVAAMKKIDWEHSPGKPDGAVSPYMETLTKETATLQRVLAKHLPEMVVASIMIQGFASYREQWSKAYQDVTVKSVAAKERMLADAEFFRSRLSKLDGAAGLGDHIINIVRAKPIVSEPGGPAKKPSSEQKPKEESPEQLQTPPPPPPPPPQQGGAEASAAGVKDDTDDKDDKDRQDGDSKKPSSS